MSMSTYGRIFGHGFGLFFMLLGGIFLWVALNDPWSNWLDENSVCEDGNCSDVGASTTFLVMGVSFVATGFISSLATEFAVRKTRGLMRTVTAAGDGSLGTVEGISDFLAPFGIHIDPSSSANANVQQRTLDLRGLRNGREVPRDPAGLSEYLKSVGVNIDESALRNATVVSGGEVIQPGLARSEAAPRTSPSMPAMVSPRDEPRRERATIVRKRDRGETAGSQRLVEFELEVQPAGKVPYRVQVASLVRESLAGLLIEGSTLNVRVDPSDENQVTIDWSEN
jgi:hypothetical protein